MQRKATQVPSKSKPCEPAEASEMRRKSFLKVMKWNNNFAAITSIVSIEDECCDPKGGICHHIHFSGFSWAVQKDTKCETSKSFAPLKWVALKICSLYLWNGLSVETLVKKGSTLFKDGSDKQREYRVDGSKEAAPTKEGRMSWPFATTGHRGVVTDLVKVVKRFFWSRAQLQIRQIVNGSRYLCSSARSDGLTICCCDDVNKVCEEVAAYGSIKAKYAFSNWLFKSGIPGRRER